MSNSVLTAAGAALIASCQLNQQVLNIDQVVFADIPGLDTSVAPPSNTVMPEAGYIVHQCAVSRSGLVNDSSVVYSAVLDSELGDFYINWMGLYCSEHNVLVAACVMPRHRKYATGAFTVGNSLVKNFALQISDVANLTGISISADTWQIDFTARLMQIDERERLSNFDIYGTKYFFDAGFNLVNNNGSYELQPGTGYVDGIRVKLDAVQPLGDVGALPKMIYIDACLTGDISGVEAFWTVQVSGVELTHYTDSVGQKHYVELLATIAADGSIIDDRANGAGGTIRNGCKVATYMLTGDTTVNFDPSMTASQIQTLINAVPKNLNGHILTFQFADGTYTFDAALTYHGFYGGEVYILGNNSDSQISGAAKSVVLNFSTVRGMNIVSCQARMSIMYIEVNISNAADDVIAVPCIDSNYVRIYYSNVNGNRIPEQEYNRGIYSGACTGVLIINTMIKNCSTAIYMDFSSVTEFGASGENNLNFALAHQTAFISNNISDGGRHCAGAIVSYGGSTVNGHEADRVGNIVSSPKLTMNGAMALYGGSIYKSDYPILTTWVYANGFAKTMDQFLANNNLRTFFIEHPTDSNIIFLPDWKGVYERGLDQSGSFDPDGAARTLMDYQDYATARPKTTISNVIDENGNIISTNESAALGFARVTKTGESRSHTNSDSTQSGIELDIISAYAGDQETRGKNVAVNYFIYYC
jgi:hypothetical protein